MKTTVRIFQGKQTQNNKYLLETLYNTGPLTTWELTKPRQEKNKQSLNAIFNKRLHDLEKKGYIKKAGKYWSLQFKGIIAVLTNQLEPKPWNEKWNKIFENYIKPIKKSPKKYAITADKIEIAELKEFLNNIITHLKDFESWVALANKVKELKEKDLINLDLLNNENLALLIITQTLSDQKPTTLNLQKQKSQWRNTKHEKPKRDYVTE